MSIVNRRQYAEAVIQQLVGVKRNGAVKALLVLMYAESGARFCNGRPDQGAHNNPLNTTLATAGSTAFNSVGVQNYPTTQGGVAAVVATLQEPAYATVRGVIAQNGVTAKRVVEAFTSSPWGTPLDLAIDVLQGYNWAAGDQDTYWPSPYATLSIGP